MKQEAISAQARQFKRHETAYKARIEPHPECADQFRLSYPDVQAGLDVIDVSAGGLGLRSPIFIPKNIRLILHVSGLSDTRDPTASLLKIRAVVRRLQMIDHKPTYQVGLQFVDPGGDDEKKLVQAVAADRRRETVAAGE
jgi:c-di-GMP-binding flagellar brake protein YcgR